MTSVRFQGSWNIDTASIMKSTGMSVREKTQLANTMRDAFSASQGEIEKLPENTSFQLRVHENKPVLKLGLNVPQGGEKHEETIPQEKGWVGMESLNSVVKRAVAFVKAMTVNTSQAAKPAPKNAEH